MTTPRVIYRKGIEPHSWCRWFNYQTLDKNSNNLVSMVGKTGSGKTWSAISICEIMSKMSGIPFNIDHIVFSLRELMELINSDKLKKGSCIVFDEPQVSISAREFQSEANKVFNYLLSTFRHRNFSLFFCTPFENLLDKSTRKLFHVRIETNGINVKDNTCKLKALYVEHVDWREQPYRKKLIMVVSREDGKKCITIPVDTWEIPKPSQEIIDLYEKKKKEFTDNLNKNILDRLNRFEEKGKSMTAKNGSEESPHTAYIDIKEPLVDWLIEDIIKYPRDLNKNRAKRRGCTQENISFAKKSKKFKEFLKKNKEFKQKSEYNPVGS